MSRLKSKAGGLDKLVGKVSVYRSKLGEYKFTVVFHKMEKVHGRRVCLVYPRLINGSPNYRIGRKAEGWFTGLKESEIRGNRLGLHEVPTQIIEDIKKNV